MSNLTPNSVRKLQQNDLFINSEIPESYRNLSIEEIHQRGAEIKKRFGNDLLILAHHYQQDGTYWFHDVSGDSLYLAQQAAKTSAKYIVFCGVHFMAECADILTGDDQAVILPNMDAGCPMADMANVPDVEKVWSELAEICGDESILPVTYVNSTAALKAFCAKHGGTVCTSSNADKILTWALKQNKKVMFFPDQYLGRNTSLALGIPAEQIVLWDRKQKNGGLSSQQVEDSRVILWDGYCYVHRQFTVEDVENVRKKIPGVQVIVHPESREDVVAASDDSGSTNKIIKVLKESPSDVKWAVGTEFHLVDRIARELKEKEGKEIVPLSEIPRICSNMMSIHPLNVLWALEQLDAGNIVNRLIVPEETKGLAKEALNRMLSLS